MCNYFFCYRSDWRWAYKILFPNYFYVIDAFIVYLSLAFEIWLHDEVVSWLFYYEVGEQLVLSEVFINTSKTKESQFWSAKSRPTQRSDRAKLSHVKKLVEIMQVHAEYEQSELDQLDEEVAKANNDDFIQEL